MDAKARTKMGYDLFNKGDMETRKAFFGKRNG